MQGKIRYVTTPALRLAALAIGTLAAITLVVLLGPWGNSDSVVQNAAADPTVNPSMNNGGAEPPDGAIPTEPNLKVAFIGDSGDGAAFQSVLNLIETEGADLIVHQGDFDYGNDPDGFFSAINTGIGPSFPYLGSVGNHDIASWPVGCTDTDGCYATMFKQRMAATGIIPDDPNLNDEMYAAQFGGLSMLFAGQTGSQTGDCSTNVNGFACFLRNRLATDRHIWRICSWHKNQAAMQMGNKSDEMGWPVYNNCIAAGAIIATGHEHSYERTKTMTNAQTQTVDLTQHPLVGGVPSNPNSLRVAPGASFVFVSGLGGEEMRPQVRCLPATYPYGCNGLWGSIYTTNQTSNVAKFGVLFIEFYVDGDPYKAHGYFKTSTGETIDSFDIHADFRDADNDGIQDAIDNCSNWDNPTQALPSWSVPAGDTDCDGYPDTTVVGSHGAETFIGTDATHQCAATSTANDEELPDTWPLDFNDDGAATLTDVTRFGLVFNSVAPAAPYNARFDYNNDGRITILDATQFATFFNKRCA